MQTREEAAIFKVPEAHAAAKRGCHKLATLLEKRISLTSPCPTATEQKWSCPYLSRARGKGGKHT